MTQTVTIISSSAVTPITPAGQATQTVDDSIFVTGWSSPIAVTDDATFTTVAGTGGSVLVQFSPDNVTWSTAAALPYRGTFTGGVPPNALWIRAQGIGATGTLTVIVPIAWTALTYPQTAALTSVTYVAPATGVAATDVANINAALVAAGNNGTVRLSTGIYSYGYKAGQIVAATADRLPALVDLNGATLKHCGLVSTATTTASYSASGGHQTISLNAGGAANFAVGDRIVFWSSTYAGGAVSNISNVVSVSTQTDQIVINALSFLTGAATGVGAFVQHDDAIYCQNYSVVSRSSTASTIFANGRIDGNASARLSASTPMRQSWASNQLIIFGAAMVTLRDVVFVNAPCDAVAFNYAPYLKVTGCHFENVYGNGCHPGGDATNSIQQIFSGNSFYNVTQLSGVTTPTIDQYGHVTQSGAICTSAGPVKVVVSNNVIDTTTRHGFSAITSTDTDFVISGNNFTNCGAGAFTVTGGKNVAITGNHALTCGRDTNQSAGGTKDQTLISGNAGADQNFAVTGNTFVDTCLILAIDAAGGTVSGNTFNTVGITNVTGNTNTILTASLVLLFSAATTGINRVTVSGNTIINAKNTANALNGIYMVRGQDLNIVGNTIVGGRMGIFATAASANPLTNVRIASNIFTDQGLSAAGGANSTVIEWSAVAACLNCAIEDNTISCNNASTQTPTAMNIFASAIAATTSLTVRNNRIRTVTARMQGILFSTAATYAATNTLTVSGNEIDQVNPADVSIRPPTTGVLTGCVFTLNRMRGGTGMPAWGTCVNTIGAIAGESNLAS